MAPNIALLETTMRTEPPTAFDLWLRGALAQGCGTADTEAVPEDLLRLLPRDEDSLPH